MPLIKIKLEDFSLKDVMADCIGVFAVHPTERGESGQFHLTHVPSGQSYLERVSYENAVAAAQEVTASDVDWSEVRSQADLTAARKAQGRAMRAKYPSDPVIHRQQREDECDAL